jgi:hypothetical protein
MKARGGSGIVETNGSRRRIENNREKKNVEYSAIGCKVTTTFIIIFRMCKREGI